MKKNVESNIFFEVQKYYFVFESRLIFFFFQMVIFSTLFRRCPRSWKLTLKMTKLFWRCLTLFSSVLKNTTLLQPCSTLDIHSAVSTLIWRCTTSRHHINLKTTLNRRWNFCWESSTIDCIKFPENNCWNSLVLHTFLFSGNIFFQLSLVYVCLCLIYVSYFSLSLSFSL